MDDIRSDETLALNPRSDRSRETDSDESVSFRPQSGDSHNFTELEPGRLIEERYRVKSLLGRGGMGVIYRVEQILLHKEYALKTLNPEQMSANTWLRFQQEAQAASLLDHPTLIKVHDFGLIEKEQPFFVMDLFPGETLAEHLKKSGPLAVDVALDVFVQVCFGLAYAHSQGVVHRDIKPSNIMLSWDNVEATSQPQVRIVDFGIAKLLNVEGENALSLTRTGEVFGTPYYMSPEQCIGHALDQRSDIYSLGCVIFESLTGLPPCLGDTALAVMMKHQSEDPPTLKQASLGKEFPDALEQIVAKMLAKLPQDRYQNLLDTAADLNRVKMGYKVDVRQTMRMRADARAAKTTQLRDSILWVWTALVCGFILGRVSVPAPSAVPTSNQVPQSATAQVPSTPAPAPARIPPTGSVPPLGKRTGEFYSEKINASDRLFHFPSEHAIGTLINLSHTSRLRESDEQIGDRGTCDAQGDVTAPKFQPLGFAANDYTCQHPDVLRHFRRDEIVLVDLGDNPYLEDNLVKEIVRFPGIHSVNLTGSNKLTNVSLAYINQLPNLTSLGIGESKITVDAVLQLKRLSKLQKLRAPGLQNAHPLVVVLQHSRVLEQLCLRASGLTGEDARMLSHVKTLKELDLSRNEIKDSDLEPLTTLPELENLAMTSCSVTPDCARYLKRMPKLKAVAIHYQEWTPAQQARFHAELPGILFSAHHINYSDY